MIDALVSGKLCRDPELKTSQNGNAYCRFALSVHVGEPENVVVSAVAFGDAAERIAKLGKGDALSVCGALKPTQWAGNDGQERHSLDVTVSGVLSVYDIKKRRAKPESDDNPTQQPRQNYHDRPYDDELPI
jgi:single-stranded DNA-binding protein